MTLNAPRLLGAATGDFLLSARVSVGFASTFDAGVLLLYGHDRLWAKLCFEYSPLHHPMVVSVVTRGTSDDANSFEVEGNQIWLRIARMGPACAFHASTDGQSWQLIRHFALGEPGDLAVGFLAQSPTGAGCDVTAVADHCSSTRPTSSRAATKGTAGRSEFARRPGRQQPRPRVRRLPQRQSDPGGRYPRPRPGSRGLHHP